ETQIPDEQGHKTGARVVVQTRTCSSHSRMESVFRVGTRGIRAASRHNHGGMHQCRQDESCRSLTVPTATSNARCGAGRELPVRGAVGRSIEAMDAKRTGKGVYPGGHWWTLVRCCGLRCSLK